MLLIRVIITRCFPSSCVLRASTDLPLTTTIVTLLPLDFAFAGRFLISPAPATVILSWATLRASGVPGSAAGRGSRVPRQHGREPTKTVKGIGLRFQQEPTAINSSPQHTDVKEPPPTHDVTCLNAASLREKDTFSRN